MTFDPSRVLKELKELRRLTANEGGAQRVAWTDTWLEARAWYKEKLKQLKNVSIHQDPAGNIWGTIPGRSEKTLLIGGHLDSVPNGGWLDGALNVLAGLEVLRHIVHEYDGVPPVTVRLVDWADEEGARFGRSLMGSSAFSGTFHPDEVRNRVDRDGIYLKDALERCGVKLDNMLEARSEQKNAAAYLELHIEQGPVLFDIGLPLGVVLGTYGVERHQIRFIGQAAHSGSTPMDNRKDALLPAAKMAELVYDITAKHGGVSTIGSCVTYPGIVTSVVGECVITLDQRHLNRAALDLLYKDAYEASYRFAREAGLADPVWETIWRIDPIHFHPELIELCDEAIKEVAGRSHRLPSGPLHDAAEVARTGIPTIMMFVQSLYGISHNKIEDTREEDLILAVKAFDRLAFKTMAWMQ